MLYSHRGIAKTWLSLSIAYAVAAGTSLLGWKASAPRRVLFVDGEMPANKMQQRLRAVLNGTPLRSPDYFRLITPDMQDRGVVRNLATPEGRKEIEEHLGGTELLILDNLSTLCSFGEENTAESWIPIQEWLLGLRARGIAVLVVHHAGKSGAQRGTSKREDVLDTVISLKRPEGYTASDGAVFDVHFEKARGFFGPDADPFTAKFEIRNGHTVWSRI